MTMSRFSGPPMNTASSTARSLFAPAASGQGRFVQPLAPRGGVAGAGVDLDKIGGQRAEARRRLVGDAGDADLAVLGQVARPARADGAGVDDRRAGPAGELAVGGGGAGGGQRAGAGLAVGRGGGGRPAGGGVG